MEFIFFLSPVKLKVIVHPEMVIVHPEMVIVRPEMVIVRPEMVIVHPEMVIVHPEMVIVSDFNPCWTWLPTLSKGLKVLKKKTHNTRARDFHKKPWFKKTACVFFSFLKNHRNQSKPCVEKNGGFSSIVKRSVDL